MESFPKRAGLLDLGASIKDTKILKIHEQEKLTREVRAEFDGFIVDAIRKHRDRDLKSLILERIRSRHTHLLDEAVRS